MEAARQQGVRWVVFASSGAVSMMRENEEPYQTLCDPDQEPPAEEWEMITHTGEPRPKGLYGVSKLWGQNLGRIYTGPEYGLSVLCVRMGHVSD